MADIVSQNLENLLNLPPVDELDEDIFEDDDELEDPSMLSLDEDEDEEGDTDSEDTISVPATAMSLALTKKEIDRFNQITQLMGAEDFGRMILMKAAEQGMHDHKELMNLVGRVDDTKAARIAEVAQMALQSSITSAQIIMNNEMQQKKFIFEREKFEKKMAIGTGGGEGGPTEGLTMVGSQKQILEQIKQNVLAATPPSQTGTDKTKLSKTDMLALTKTDTVE